MFPTFSKVLSSVRPKAFLLENVNGLASRGLQSQLAYVKLQLANPGLVARSEDSWHDHRQWLEVHSNGGAAAESSYEVSLQTLNAADYGVPQIRKRVFFVGFRRDLSVEWEFPTGSHSKEALLREQWVTGEYWRRHGVRRSHATRPTAGVIKRLERNERPTLQPWLTVRDAISGLPMPSQGGVPTQGSQHIRIPGARRYSGHTGSPLDYPAKPLKAGVHGVPGGENMLVNANGKVRYLTVRECARIQTFPNDWRFQGRWSHVTRQLGNAVPVALAEVMAKSLKDALMASTPREAPGRVAIAGSLAPVGGR